MKVVIDHAKCQGHAMCYNYAPEMFELDDDGYNRMEPFQISKGQRVIAERAVEACPERAISLVED
ncbi:ferredoxin [Sphingomonas immobilis]|uniref:Ferredoxin n=1 Tax=Sphingomonas immobilis TaxID=3063997 RepID=A0ABT9A260_9SPHN|nr:ferredoxin [Sphingomonas sp. CA1-15]MDO7843923.1 ferredoxin [Sphingomonas sp. CA1-15]